MTDYFKAWWDSEGSRQDHIYTEDAARAAFEQGVKVGILIQKSKEFTEEEQ